MIDAISAVFSEVRCDADRLEDQCDAEGDWAEEEGMYNEGSGGSGEKAMLLFILVFLFLFIFCSMSNCFFFWKTLFKSIYPLKFFPPKNDFAQICGC